MKKYSMTFKFLKSSHFLGAQKICFVVKAKRKVNIPIFATWHSHYRSGPEFNSARSHTFLRVFTALGQFTEMVKSSQIMGMNKQKYLYSYFRSKLVSFKPVLPVLE